MYRILIIKTGALGDVLRTTSILPGLFKRYEDLKITWVISRSAHDLVARHELVNEVITVSPKDGQAVIELGKKLAKIGFDRVLSFDDEEPLCRLASYFPLVTISGAYLDESGHRRYTKDCAPWFDMGLISQHGKEKADELKLRNERSHPEIFADMLGIEMGRPEMPLTEEECLVAAKLINSGSENETQRTLIGLNTGSGGRWPSKGLSVEKVLELVAMLSSKMECSTTFLVLGGPEEEKRNAQIMNALQDYPISILDGGTANSIPEFCALVSHCDLLISSDSLALHLGVSQRVPIIAFFAPTSAAEIHLYGEGRKIVSTAADYCSYKPNADNSTITPKRITDAALSLLTS